MKNTIWIWGRHPVLEAIRAGSARSVLLARGRKPAPILQEITALAGERGVPIREVAPHEIERLAPGQNTQGIAAEVAERRLSGVDELLSASGATTTRPFFLALDQIQDPQNFGALLRTADAAGVQGVIVPQRRSAPVSGAVARTSAGAISHVPIVEVTNLTRALQELKVAGIWIVGLDESADTSIYAVDLRESVVLAVGSEGSGLRRLTRETCDFLVKLPMLGAVGSLNAGVAGSIAMYEVVRQRSL